MQTPESIHKISVTWRGNKFVLEINSGATLKELGQELQKLTDVKEDTLRLIVPQFSNGSSKLLSPFSDEHAALNLPEISLLEGRLITMMGVPEVEVNEVLQNAKANLRIAGFEEEEKKLRLRTSDGPHTSLKLPQGPYIFCDFRTLHLPGVELNPPPSEALKRMHTLAADPGIIAIMNKHRWRVGIMTEMAPVGYVGVSPKCILGFNKNHGEEISLRLRTDDLKGFRKYESIKKTLLHELAHMVHSEHDANFYALDKQLNQEAASLDWTRSRSHTLNGVGHSEHYDAETYVNNSSNVSHKLGGNAADQLANALASSVAAAYTRLEIASTNQATSSKLHEEPDPDDLESNTHEEKPNITNRNRGQNQPGDEEPDPDDIEFGEAMESEKYSELIGNRISSEPDPDDVEMEKVDIVIQRDEPDPDDDERVKLGCENIVTTGNQSESYKESDPDDSKETEVVAAEPDPDDSLVPLGGVSGSQTDEPDPDDQELRRIRDPVAIVCNRLQKAIEMLRAEVNPSVAVQVLQTLFKIIRNVIENPNEIKFKRLRKANPVIQRNVANYKAAMEILFLIGFNEDVVMDEIGKAETYLVLKRNDPGLLWLAKSSLETCIAY